MKHQHTARGAAFTSEPAPQARANARYAYEVHAADPEDERVTLRAVQMPGWLAFTDNGDGTGLLAGTPGPNDAGESPVTLTASDGSQTVVQDFMITVSLPPPPEAVDDVVVTNEEGPVVIEVLANDRAPNPEALSIVEWTRPSAGEVSLTDAGLRYVPARDATGLDAFSYTISDEYGQTDQASVQVQVNACIDFDALTPADLDVGPGFFFEEDGTPVFVDTFYFGAEGVFDQVLLNDAADFQEVIGQGQVLTTETVNLFFDLRNAPVPYLSFAFLDRTGGEAAANVSINEDSLYVIPGLQNGFQAPEGIRVRLAEIGLTSFGLRGRATLQAEPPTSIQSLRIGGTFLSIDNVCAGEAPSP